MTRLLEKFITFFSFFYHKGFSSKGFTLIELLVVIAIVAVLAVAVILTLNPAELLRQARDSTRISDLNVIKKSISLYLVSATTPSVSSTCSLSIATATPSGTCNGRYNVSQVTPSQGNGRFTINGAGWVSIDFTAIASGAPISNLPRDPSNSTGTATAQVKLYYSYRGVTASSVFELGAEMESTKYKSGGKADVVSTDGGDNSTSTYEVGSKLDL